MTDHGRDLAMTERQVRPLLVLLHAFAGMLPDTNILQRILV